MAVEYKMETNASFEERKITWTVKNFSKLPDLVKSPPIFPMSGCAIKWELWMEFKYESGHHYMLLGIKNVSGKDLFDMPMKAVGSFKFKNSNGTVLEANRIKTFEKTVYKTDVVTVAKLNYSYKLPTSVTNIFTLINDIFILECHMAIYGIVTSSVSPVSVFAVSDSYNDKSETLKSMYKKTAFCDFTINIGEDKIHTHKLILSARSPVFERMFQHDTLENKTNSMNLEDFRFNVFNSFITYLYTWQIDEIIASDFRMLLELYEIADKYAITDLQKRCVQILLTEFLNTDNVCVLLEVADRHKDQPFKEIVLQFFHHKFSEVTITTEWKEFLKRNLHLAAEVVSYVTSMATTNNTDWSQDIKI